MLNGQHICLYFDVCDSSSCWLSPPASSLVPGRPAAGHVAPGSSNEPSSARCCCPSPRLLLTCPMTSARGSNLQQVSPATALPALVFQAKRKKVKRKRRRRRRRPREKSCTTGSMRASQSVQRAVVEVWILIYHFNSEAFLM